MTRRLISLRPFVKAKREENVSWAHIARMCGVSESGLRAVFDGDYPKDLTYSPQYCQPLKRAG